MYISQKGGGQFKLSEWLSAFTLAEVLVTLAIIGVVAAMTMPSLINSTQKKELQTGLQKHYSVIEQALLQYEYDNGEALLPQNFGPRTVKSEFMKYFSVMKDCNLSDCVPTSNVSDIYKTYNGKPAYTGWLDEGQFVTADGALYMIQNSGSNNWVSISVDVNGYNKKPNKFGHDVFSFSLTPDGKLLPIGQEGSPFDLSFCGGTFANCCSKTSDAVYNGLACTHSALTDENYWKNLP